MFSESRLEVRGRPMISARADTFWDEKLGQLNVLKGNVWLTVNAGPAGLQKREPEAAKKLAEALMPKIWPGRPPGAGQKKAGVTGP